MKKLSLSLSLLLSGIPCISYAQPHHWFDVSVPRCEGGLTIGLTGLYLRPSVPHLDYAESFPNIDFTATNPVIFGDGAYHSVDPEYDFGFEVYVGYEIPCTGNEIRLAYRRLDTDDHDSLVAPAILSAFTSDTFLNGGSALDFNGENTSKARSRAEFDYDVADLEFAQRILIGCHTDVRFFGGLRYANLDHHFDVEFVSERLIDIIPVDSNLVLTIEQQNHFNGIGPRFGTDINYGIFNGFGIVAHSAAALLVGEQDSAIHLRETIRSTFGSSQPIFNEDVARFQHPDETRVVPNLELKLGLAYTTQFCRCRSKLTVEAGWLVDHYWNTIDRLANQDFSNGMVAVTQATILDSRQNLNSSLRSRQSLDTSFDGPYLSIKVVI